MVGRAQPRQGDGRIHSISSSITGASPGRSLPDAAIFVLRDGEPGDILPLETDEPTLRRQDPGMQGKRNRIGPWSAAVVLVVLSTGLAVPAAAQVHIFSIGLSGGVAGSFDEDEGGFSNTTFQARFAMETTEHNNIAVRIGRMDFEDNSLSQAVDPTIDYLSISGEYLFTEASYESGFFMGLGYYDLSGSRLDGSRADETGIGLQFGAVGEFRLAERWFVFADASFHYVSIDAAQLFGGLQLGVGFRF